MSHPDKAKIDMYKGIFTQYTKDYLHTYRVRYVQGGVWLYTCVLSTLYTLYSPGFRRPPLSRSRDLTIRPDGQRGPYLGGKGGRLGWGGPPVRC